MKNILITFAFLMLLTSSGCVTNTFGLTEQQQQIARTKYPVPPGLNLVKDETIKNSAKILARCMLFPLTLGLSEGILCVDREYPYQKYYADLQWERKQKIRKIRDDLSRELPNFFIIQDIWNEYCKYRPKTRNIFLTYVNEKNYKETQKEYWLSSYLFGVAIIKIIIKNKIVETNGMPQVDTFNPEDLYLSSSNKITKFLIKIQNNLINQNQEYEYQAFTGYTSQNNLNYYNSSGNMLQNSNSSLKMNHYGLGVHSDQFGRPQKLEVINQPNQNTDLLQIKPNCYGPGIHSDQFGRPVRSRPWP